MKQKKSLIRNDGFQSLLASLLCILVGLLIGYLVLLIIEPKGAFEAILAVMKNFFKYGKAAKRMQYFGQTIVKTMPLLMCALSVLFAYKVGMFNIGAAGQYVAGACASLFCAIYLHLPWYLCLLAAILAGALLGGISGTLKTTCNVNIVISGIMLNWVMLYITNMVLSSEALAIKNPSSPYTKSLSTVNTDALLPKLGLDKLFNNEKTVTIAIPLAIIMAVLIWVLLSKTKFGYELKATGYNPNAAKYCGMKENRNIILTMVIAGGLAGMGAALYYLTGIEEWETTISSVPDMGFNGIAVAFLGNLNPLGCILSAYFIQHITSGGGNVNLQVYCSQISSLISALIIYLCAFAPYFRSVLKRWIRKSDEKKAVRAKALENKEGGAE